VVNKKTYQDRTLMGAPHTRPMVTDSLFSFARRSLCDPANLGVCSVSLLSSGIESATLI